jgi:hypothetical protein
MRANTLAGSLLSGVRYLSQHSANIATNRVQDGNDIWNGCILLISLLLIKRHSKELESLELLRSERSVSEYGRLLPQAPLETTVALHPDKKRINFQATNG